MPEEQAVAQPRLAGNLRGLDPAGGTGARAARRRVAGADADGDGHGSGHVAPGHPGHPLDVFFRRIFIDHSEDTWRELDAKFEGGPLDPGRLSRTAWLRAHGEAARGCGGNWSARSQEQAFLRRQLLARHPGDDAAPPFLHTGLASVPLHTQRSYPWRAALPDEPELTPRHIVPPMYAHLHLKDLPFIPAASSAAQHGTAETSRDEEAAAGRRGDANGQHERDGILARKWPRVAAARAGASARSVPEADAGADLSKSVEAGATLAASRRGGGEGALGFSMLRGGIFFEEDPSKVPWF